MAKGAVRTIVVRRWISVVCLLLTTVAIAMITLSLSGRAYSKVDPVPFREVRLLVDKLSDDEPTPMPVVIALFAPVVMNILLFMPWGFLMFIILDHDRHSAQSYLITILLATALSLGIELWQYFLPTRVTDINDLIWNVSGALLGAILGHLRKRVRVAFE